MLKNRLTFGPLMLAAPFARCGGFLTTRHKLDRPPRVWNHLDTADRSGGSGVGGIGLMVILALILPLATVELATLFAAERVRPYRFICGARLGRC